MKRGFFGNTDDCSKAIRHCIPKTRVKMVVIRSSFEDCSA